MSNSRWIPDGQGGFNILGGDGGHAVPDGLDGFRIISNDASGIGLGYFLAILLILSPFLVVGIPVAFLTAAVHWITRLHGTKYAIIWSIVSGILAVLIVTLSMVPGGIYGAGAYICWGIMLVPFAMFIGYRYWPH